ncbi:MAG: hypothetical protein IJT54_00765 [Candidatus Methanomethylophilaceae archaeon]|nr:hypothetical protein [Candidatus Methanomethylophilaceae archaeon]
MICEILVIILSVYIIRKRRMMREKLKDAETVELHYPDGSFTYISEKDLL